MSTRRTVNGALLNMATAAAYLGGSERWLRRLVAKGCVPLKREGRNIYFKREWLDEFIDGKKKGTGSLFWALVISLGMGAD